MSKNQETDYRDTLNLPQTDFPMKADLPTREPGIAQVWADNDTYNKTAHRADAPKFVLHDGPPYSNGDIHLGHALNKTLKDIIVKYKAMQGFAAPYVPGWDNHGLPIEVNVTKEFRARKETPDKVTLRKACREYAAGYVERQKGQFKRLGIRGDWENPYLTMSTRFEAEIVRTFGVLAERGYIYRGLKPVQWCPTDETALADAELEYADVKDLSIYVRFLLRDDPKGIFAGLPAGKCYTAIWTTTPWTIPANVAVTVSPVFDYVVAQRKEDGCFYLIAEGLLKDFMTLLDPTPEGRSQEEVSEEEESEGEESEEASETTEVDEWIDPNYAANTYRVVKLVPGIALAGLTFHHPLHSLGAPFDRESRLVHADYVTLDAGTGLVHTAPGHGKEDFETGAKFDLPTLQPVLNDGRYDDTVGETFAGLHIFKEGNAKVIEVLKNNGNLLKPKTYLHSYPHCWRCHNPVITRATVQWFMNIDHDGFREKALAEIGTVSWYPAESVNRISAMVSGRPDWCVSRQRAWGVGIPVFYYKGQAVLTPESVQKVYEMTLAEGSDVWYERSPREILGDDWVCPLGGSADEYEKETDVLDVWFDSGSTCRAVLETRPELQFPADVYLEGSDQHRGWFNSSLMIGTATKDAAPYKAVITNGWTLDDKGKPMHKSSGNVVAPSSVVDLYGADVLRLWVASVNYFEDVRLGQKILDQVVVNYRNLRNPLKFLLGSLFDFDPAANSVPVDELTAVDRWALDRLQRLVGEVTTAYETYEFHRALRAINDYCAGDLSAFYLNVIKDRLYADAPNSPERRSTQTALYAIASAMTRLLAPILSHTAEEAWQLLPGAKEEYPSVELAPFPVPDEAFLNDDLAASWGAFFTARDRVNKSLEDAKNKGMKKSLETRVTLVGDFAATNRFTNEDLAMLFGVSDVSREANSLYASDLQSASVAERIEVGGAVGSKCPRCWLVKRDIGRDPLFRDICERCAGAVRAIGG